MCETQQLIVVFIFCIDWQTIRYVLQINNQTPNSYLIFVISFTQAKFLENKIYTEKRVNYKNRILLQNSVNQDLLGQATKKVCKTKLSVKAHLVCVKLKKKEYRQITQIV